MKQYKTCRRCNSNLPIAEFHQATDSPDGHRAQCRNCIRQADAIRYLAKQEINKARALNYYYQNQAEIAKTSAIRYAKNKSTISERRRQKRLDNIWHYKKLERAAYLRNQEQRKIQRKLYEINNPEKVKAKNARRRAALKNAIVYEISNKQIERLYSSNCLFCPSKSKVDLDHVIPLSRGGSHGIGNLMPLCDNCNSTKYNKTIMEWRIYRIRIGKPLPLDQGKNL